MISCPVFLEDTLAVFASNVDKPQWSSGSQAPLSSFVMLNPHLTPCVNWTIAPDTEKQQDLLDTRRKQTSILQIQIPTFTVSVIFWLYGDLLFLFWTMHLLKWHQLFCAAAILAVGNMGNWAAFCKSLDRNNLQVSVNSAMTLKLTWSCELHPDTLFRFPYSTWMVLWLEILPWSHSWHPRLRTDWLQQHVLDSGARAL